VSSYGAASVGDLNADTHHDDIEFADESGWRERAVAGHDGVSTFP